MSNDVIGLYGTIGAISVIEAILRILAYVAFICLSFKGVQALNTYINKNSR